MTHAYRCCESEKEIQNDSKISREQHFAAKIRGVVFSIRFECDNRLRICKTAVARARDDTHRPENISTSGISQSDQPRNFRVL
jgi:hypothetical protein